MNKKVLFKFGQIQVEAELYDTPIAGALWDEMPIESTVNLWGNEIYFEITVYLPSTDNETKDVQLGDIAYWSMGRAICIFFGPTPLSKGTEIVPVAPVHILGRIVGDIEALKEIEEREIVEITRIQIKEV